MDGCRSWGMKVKNISRKEGKINGLLTDCVIVVSPPPFETYIYRGDEIRCIISDADNNSKLLSTLF